MARRPLLDYDPDRCAYLLEALQTAARNARSMGYDATRAVHYGNTYEATRCARLAARYGMAWRAAWLEHNERIEGIRRLSCATCWPA